MKKIPNSVHFPYGKNMRKELIIHRFEDKNMDEKVASPSNDQNVDLQRLQKLPVNIEDKSIQSNVTNKSNSIKSS